MQRRAGGDQDITYPTDVMTPGIVTLIVNLDNSGQVQNLDVLRDLPPLTSVASAAIRSWSFRPASLDENVQSLTPQTTKAVKSWTFGPATYQGTPIASHMVIAFVFPSPATGSF